MGVGGQHHAPTNLLPGKTRYPLYRRLGRPQGRSGRVRKISPPPSFDPPDRPARSESLYRLCYPGPYYFYMALRIPRSRIFAVLFSLSRQISTYQYLKSRHGCFIPHSFQFTNYSTIRHYIVWPTDSVVKWATKKLNNTRNLYYDMRSSILYHTP